MDDYQKQYDKLNPEQQNAVSCIEGPVLVVAGPGTGKTQLIGMRVANILKTTDTNPSNILCLTFTNKASKNMKDRLLKLAGPTARKVSVKTFHSFSAEIMNQYPEHFWNGATLTTAPDTVQLEIIQDILAKLPPDNPLALKFAGKYTSINPVLKAIQLTKDAGLTPGKLRALINANLAYIDVVEPQMTDILSQTLGYKKLPDIQIAISNLPDQPIDKLISPLKSLKTVITDSLAVAIELDEGTNKTTNTGKWKSKWIKSINGQRGMHDERKRNNWWLELATVYEQYRNNLHERGYYDYSDMLIEVIYQMEHNPELLADIQERYNYVMIDEFQDSNYAQLRLAHLVADHESANGRPNIMVVGDDDQSIYGFNGAELNNMLFLEETYEDVTEIVLTKNYRSNQAVIDASEKIIQQASDRLTTRRPHLDKKLQSAKEKRQGDIAHYIYPTREHQLNEVVKQIKAYRKKDSSCSIAVLARGNESLRNLSAILLQNDLPVSYEQQNNILDFEVIKQVITLANLVAAIQDNSKEQVNALLATTLRHPMWQINPSSLWQLAVQTKDKDWLQTMSNSSDKTLEDIASHLFWLASQADHQPITLVIEYIIGLRPGENYTSPIREYFASKKYIDNEYLSALSALQLLRQLVRDFSQGSNPTLRDFINFIDINTANNKIISDQSPFVSASDAIELYSVHKAKGLEFDIVFVIDAIEDNWKPKASRQLPPANLPLQPPMETDDDYARLLFVATTRAKHTVIATSYDLDHASKEVSPASLLRGMTEPTVSNVDYTTEQTVELLEQFLRWPRLSHTEEKEFLKGKLEHFSINVTNLLNFLDVSRGGPSYFFERNILRLPEAKTGPLSLGTAVHETLEFAQKLVNKDTFNLSQVIDEFYTILSKEYLPELEQKRLREQGILLLNSFFDMYSLPKGSKPEQRLKAVRLDKAVIDGKLDRVDELSEKLVIVDYKTGKPLSSFDTTNKAQVIKAWRQKTQLIFYALLAQNHPLFGQSKQIEGQMIFVQAESAKNLIREYTPTQQEIDKLQNIIEVVWDKVKQLDLPDTSDYSPDIEGIQKFETDLLLGKI